jgi:uncharacterized membrane protein (DUF485 family)
MRRLLQRIFDVSRYDSLIEKDRARLVYTITSVLILICLFFIPLTAFPAPSATPAPTNTGSVGGNVYLIGFVIFLAGLLVTFAVTRQGHSQLGSIMVVVLTSIMFGGGLTVYGIYRAQEGMALIVLVALSGLLLGERGLFVGTGMAALIFIVSMSLRPKIPMTTLNATIGWETLWFKAAWGTLSSLG